NLPESVPLLIEHCQAIVTAMTGNAYFLTPTPPLATLTAKITASPTAQRAALTKTQGAAPTRDSTKRAPVKDMSHLCANVQLIAAARPGQEEMIILSAGMSIKRVTPRKPRSFTATDGSVTGSVDLVHPPVVGRKSSYWQWSTDQKAWNDAPPTAKAS